jgi:hypothetical protein
MNVTYNRISDTVKSQVFPKVSQIDPSTLNSSTLQFNSKEEWEKYKKELKEMAQYHMKILKKIKEGKIKTRKVIDFNI